MRRRPTSLRLVRVAAGISMKEISRRTGINLPRLSRIERAIVRPTRRELRLLVSALGPKVTATLTAARRFLRDSARGERRDPEPPEAA